MGAPDRITEACELEADAGYFQEEELILLGPIRTQPGTPESLEQRVHWFAETPHSRGTLALSLDTPPAPGIDNVLAVLATHFMKQTVGPADTQYFVLRTRLAQLERKQQRTEQQLRQLQDTLTQSVEAAAHWQAVEAELDEEMRQAGIEPPDAAGSVQALLANAYPFIPEALDRLVEDED